MNTTKAAMKYSFFTPALTRTLKSSRTRLHCNVDADGMIYICNGYFVVKVTGPEYDALIRPATQRDAGNWALNESGELASVEPIDLIRALDDAGRTAAHTLAPAPMLFDLQRKDKTQLVGYYSQTGDFVAAFNSAYASIVSPTLEHKSNGSTSPMVIYAADDTPMAMILPVKVEKANIIRAVRAWFIDEDGTTQAQEESDELRRENEQLRQEYAKEHIGADALRRQVDELQAAIISKNEQIDALAQRLDAQPDPQPQEIPDLPQPQDKVAALSGRLAMLQGVTVTVKGAQTAAPVVWLSGDTDAHKDEIQAMGGKWSGKRSAWYFRI